MSHRAVISPRGAGSAPFSGLPGRGAAGPGGGGGGGAELLSSNLRSYMDEMKDMMRELVFGLQADMVRQSLASEVRAETSGVNRGVGKALMRGPTGWLRVLRHSRFALCSFGIQWRGCVLGAAQNKRIAE